MKPHASIILKRSKMFAHIDNKRIGDFHKKKGCRICFGELTPYRIAEFLICHERIELFQPVGRKNEPWIVELGKCSEKGYLDLNALYIQGLKNLRATLNIDIYQYCVIHGKTPCTSSPTAISIARAFSSGCSE